MNLYKETQINEVTPRFKFSAVNNKDVKAEINDIKSKAVGSDDISINMIK